MKVITGETNSPYGTKKKKKHSFSRSTYNGRSCNFITFAVITELQMGEMSQIGLIDRVIFPLSRDIGATCVEGDTSLKQIGL
jgi:hypothetical protein